MQSAGAATFCRGGWNWIFTVSYTHLEQLRKTPQAVRYLSGRGLSEKTILHFGLGYAPEGWDNLLRHLEQKGYTLSLIHI